MAFHFLLMPRPFMALAREDRELIADIVARPGAARRMPWALFRTTTS
jgi:hypothetical protein